MSTTPLIYARMAAILADVEPVEKGRTNSAQGFKFRGIDDAFNMLNPIFGRHKVFITTELIEHTHCERQTKNNSTTNYHTALCKFTFWAEDGSSVSAVTKGESADTGDKGLGKAISYALKLCLFQTFLVPTESDNDPDAHATEFSPRPQQQQAPAFPRAAPGVVLYQATDAQREMLRKIVAARGVTADEVKRRLHKEMMGKPMTAAETVLDSIFEQWQAGLAESPQT